MGVVLNFENGFANRTMLIVLATSAMIVAGYISGCTYHASMNSSALKAVNIGDSYNSVVLKFGRKPSVTELQGRMFGRYANIGCLHPCAVRVWFENEYLPGIEAWSLELDLNQKVVKKTHWVSP
jgi:hypothetical protein